jgi:hypothetical protein
MADQKEDAVRSLEMRVAELEDKLAKLHVTEEEMRAYEKVAALLGGGTSVGNAAAAPGADFGALQPAAPGQAAVCQISRSRLVCISRGVPRVVRQLCYECTCGPCIEGGGFSGPGGGGFGNFGM